MNGITASTSVIGANPSSSVVTTWIASNTTASSEMSRCRAPIAKRGKRARRTTRMTDSTPSTTTADSRISATIPLPRVRYQ